MENTQVVFEKDDYRYMKQAITQAKKAYKLNEVPIGCASRYMNDWRLENCTLYVTLEPCQMCAGAIVQARIPRVVIGSMNPKAGCAGSILNILQIPTFNHQCEITKGVCEEECSEMLTTFFKELRKSKKKNTAVTTDGE